jgi:ABC-type uncharacterized transport system permease subunit
MELDIVISVLQRTIIASVPLLLGTLGEIITERAGILNLGVEGMMSVGAISGFIATFTTGSPLLGMLVAIIAGAIFSQIHAFVSISLNANQVVSGLALTMAGLGFSGLVGKPYIGRPLEVKMLPIKIPLLGDIPILGDILFNHDIYFYLAVIIGISLYILLYKTKIGITLRSVGENPKAAEAQGISVTAVRYGAVAIGGALAGMAGGHISTAYSSSWIEGITVGRGWIVIALTIFAAWNPLKAFGGAFLFGVIFVLQFILQPLGISPSFLAMLPYLGTLIILMVFGFNRESHRKMNAPAKLGEAFKRGER